MCGAAEAVQAEPRCLAGHQQCPVADKAPAEQRRDFDVAVPGGERETETGVGDEILGEAAIDVAAREARRRRRGSPAPSGSGRRSRRPTQPGDADAVADPDLGDGGTGGHDRGDV